MRQTNLRHSRVKIKRFLRFENWPNFMNSFFAIVANNLNSIHMSSLIYIRMIQPITWWRHVVSRWKITWLISLKKKPPMILEFNRSFQIEDHTSILVTCQQLVITFEHQVEIYWAIMRRHLAVTNVLSVRIVHRLNQKTVLQKFFIAQIVEIRLVIADFK